MTESWSYYMDDFDFEDESRMSSLLPSSMRDVITDDQQEGQQIADYSGIGSSSLNSHHVNLNGSNNFNNMSNLNGANSMNHSNGNNMINGGRVSPMVQLGISPMGGPQQGSVVVDDSNIPLRPQSLPANLANPALTNGSLSNSINNINGISNFNGIGNMNNIIDIGCPSNGLSGSDQNNIYYTINFHAKRTQICSVSPNLNLSLKRGDYVITEADRGRDMGMIVNEATKQDARDQKVIHKILRIATSDEISILPEKRQREERSVALCQSTVQEQRLNMKIIDAEYQFDGTQLTFYYTTNHYIDFRSLVRVLFRTFGTRIWMVWYDGQAPVKDVFSQNDRKKNQNRKDKKGK
ncbi:hypothetical protein TRFO_42495 [Tritrichomonas foetus]|uniref:PSP1 C-terminal domain-containing protein n=1 Tax=Tritrichomonas foetus TaxID=1144522 RepID=A0A1J4L0D7_9EUKA|nr:hypothetical protein TRFO_42495 [Tritrichomonas foetus]|eukprot:OHT15430.1 hypothetical protein TRFO_42495 [Tritrichomonas foetus]